MWMQKILQHVCRQRLRANLPKVITSFLLESFFYVWVGETITTQSLFKNGVSHAFRQSSTLLITAINDIFKVIRLVHKIRSRPCTVLLSVIVNHNKMQVKKSHKQNYRECKKRGFVSNTTSVNFFNKRVRCKHPTLKMNRVVICICKQLHFWIRKVM